MIWRKINAEKFSVSALSFFQSQRRYSLPFFVPVFYAVVMLQPSFSFLFCVLPFIFQPKILFFSLNVFQLFSPNVFQPKNTFFQPKKFCFSQKLFSVQPKTFFFFFFSVQPLFSSSFFCFILFWFNPLFFSLLVPPFFLFFSSIYPRPNIRSSCFTSLLFE